VSADQILDVTHWPDAEASLIRGLFHFPDAPEHVFERSGLHAKDFTVPRLQSLFEAFRAAHEAGLTPDPYTVSDELRAIDPTIKFADVSAMYEERPPKFFGLIVNACDALRKATARREFALDASRVSRVALDNATPLSRLHEEATTAVDALGARLLGMKTEVDGLYIGDVMRMLPQLAEDDDGEWVVPFLLRVREAMLMVGSGGAGKSFLLRQIAACVQNAVHPFTAWPLTMAPKSALVVETETGKADFDESMQILAKALSKILGIPIGDILIPHLFHWTQGSFDLRNPEVRMTFEKVLQKTRPEIVCVGPLKYMVANRPGERDDQAAVALQVVLNRLAAKHDFAWVIEAHASKSEPHRPAGSVRWEDWPSIGFAIDYEYAEDEALPAEAYRPYKAIPFRAFRNRRAIFDATLHRSHPEGSLPWMFGSKTGLVGKRLVQGGYMSPQDLNVPLELDTNQPGAHAV